MTTRTFGAARQPSPNRQTMHASQLLLPGVLLFILSAQFMTVIMLAAAMAPGYDLSGGAISDLGVLDETAMLFNTSLVLAGVLSLAAGLLLFRASGRRRLLAAFAIAGLGAAGAGLVPLDRGDMHGIFALLAFVFFNVEALVMGSLVTGPMRVASWITGVLGLGFVALMVIGDSGNPGVFGAMGHGGAERMIVYPVMLWMLGLGGYLMAGGPVSSASGSAERR